MLLSQRGHDNGERDENMTATKTTRCKRFFVSSPLSINLAKEVATVSEGVE